jgi:hypothetical protein
MSVEEETDMTGGALETAGEDSVFISTKYTCPCGWVTRTLGETGVGIEVCHRHRQIAIWLHNLGLLTVGIYFCRRFVL